MTARYQSDTKGGKPFTEVPNPERLIAEIPRMTQQLCAACHEQEMESYSTPGVEWEPESPPELVNQKRCQGVGDSGRMEYTCMILSWNAAPGIPTSPGRIL